MSWWDGWELVFHPRVVRDGKPPEYVDWYIELSSAEVREIHEQQKPYAYQYGFKLGAWPEIIEREMTEVENLFHARAAEFSHFRIELFDYSSTD